MSGRTKNKFILKTLLPGVLFLIGVFLVMLIFIPETDAVSIKTVQRGRVSIGAQERAGTADINAVDVSKSILVVTNFATKNTADDEQAALCTAEFSSDSQIYVTRNDGGGNSTNAEYMVVEFNDNVNVQGGYSKIAYNSDGRGVYLGSAVDTSKSFIIATTLSPVTHSYKSDMFCTYKFGASNRIDFKRNSRNNQDVIEYAWYVVEFNEDVNVYHGETTLSSGTTSIPDVSIGGTIDPAKSFVVLSYRAGAAASTFADIKVAAELNTDGTTLTLSRKGSSTDVICDWSVVEFTDGTVVQSDKITDNNSDTSVGINASDGQRAFAFINNNTATTGTQCREWQMSDNVGGLSGTYANPATTLDFDRGGTALMDIVWQVVECPPVSVVSPNGGESWRVGTQYNIEWEHADSVTSGGTGYDGNHKIKIELSLDDGSDGYPYLIYQSPGTPAVDEYNCASNLYPWTIPNTISSTDIIGASARIKITDTDENASTSQSVYDTSDDVFEILANIDLTYPEGGQVMAYEALPTDSPPGQVTWDFYGHATGRTVTIKYDTNSGLNNFTDGTLASSIAADYNSGSFPIDWVTAPLSLGDRLRVRIELDQDPTRVKDESAADFTVTAALTLEDPLPTGDTWKIGDTKTIYWSANGSDFMPSGVKIELSRNSGGTYSQINQSTVAADAGSWQWLVEAPDSAEARIKITSIDFPSINAESGNFTIQQTITVDSPVVAGTIWRIGEAKDIEYTLQGNVPNIDIHYSTLASPDPLNDADWTEIASGVDTTANPEAYAWPGGVANVQSDTVRLRVRDTSDHNIYGISNVFKIKGNITITEPALNQVFHYGVAETVSWNVQGNVTGTAEIFINNGTGYTSIGTKTITGEGPYNISFTPNDPANHLGVNCTMKVEMQGDPDTAGTLSPFKVRPNITITYPVTPGESFNVDDPSDKVYIQWTPEPEDFGTVEICYDRNGGAEGYPVANVVNTGGSIASNNKPNGTDIGYEWQVPDDVGMVTNTMRVKVYKTGEYDDVSDISANFKVLGTLTLTGTSDGDSSVWKIGENHTITWTAKGDITPVNIYYSLDDGSSWNDLAIEYAAGSGDRECNDVWNPIPDDVLAPVPNSVRETDVKFRITGAGGTIEDISSGNITIQARITLSKPNAGSVFTVVQDTGDDPTTYTENQISWTYNGDAFDSASFDIKYDINGAGTYAGTVQTGASAVAGGWSQWIVPDIIGNQVKVKVMAQGADGAFVYAESPEFTVKGQIRITSPTSAVSGANSWIVDNTADGLTSTEDIQYYCHGSVGGSSGTVTVEYAPDDVNFVALPGVADYDSQPGAHGPHTISGWTIPDNIGSNNKIRIIDNEDVYTPAETAVSDAFEIRGKLILLEPQTGQWYYVSTSQDIRWQYQGNLGNINLSYSTNGGVDGYPNSIATVAYNYGKVGTECYYPWTVPATAGNQYSVKIEQANPPNVNDKTLGEAFSLLGSVTLDSPGKNPGSPEVWYVDDDFNNIVTYTIAGGVANVDIDLDVDGAPYNYPIEVVSEHATGGNGQKTYVWQIPEASWIAVTSSTCRVKVSDSTNPGIVNDESTNDFEIKPKVYINALSGTPWTISQSPEITWEPKGNISKVRIYYSNDDKATWHYVKDAAFTAGATGSTNWFIDPAASFENVTETGKLSYLKLVRYDGDVEDADVTSESSGFTVYGKLTLNLPLTSQEYNILGTGTINWSPVGAVGDVEIKYSTDDAGGYPDASFTGSIAGPLAADWCDINGDYSMSIPNDPTPNVKIRVREVNNPNTVKVDTPICKFKGNILFNQGTTNGQSLTVGTEHTISWENIGDFSSTFLKVYYRVDGGQWQDIDTNLAGNTGGVQSCPWTPGDNDISDDVDFKVELGNDATIYRTTDDVGASNTVSGSLTLESPTLGTEEYIVGQQGTISWLKYGNIGDLKIELNVGGGWLDNTADGTNLPDNQSSGTSGTTQSLTTWNVPDKITNNGQIRITSNSYPSLTDETAAIHKFKIKGTFNSMVTPVASTVWKVGDD